MGGKKNRGILSCEGMKVLKIAHMSLRVHRRVGSGVGGMVLLVDSPLLKRRAVVKWQFESDASRLWPLGETSCQKKGRLFLDFISVISGAESTVS